MENPSSSSTRLSALGGIGPRRGKGIGLERRQLDGSWCIHDVWLRTILCDADVLPWDAIIGRPQGGTEQYPLQIPTAMSSDDIAADRLLQREHGFVLGSPLRVPIQGGGLTDVHLGPVILVDDDQQLGVDRKS